MSEHTDVRLQTGELPVLERPVAESRRHFRLTLKLLVVLVVLYYFALPLLPGFREAWGEFGRIEPILLVLGFTLEIVALWCYAPLMKAALGDAGERLSLGRFFRIQMSTRALSSIVPGGSAASSALGYRLMTLSGVSGPDAGFALATVGLGSAVVLNLILWIALIISIPIRGVNALYGTAALAGVIVMLIAAALVFGLMEGQGRAEKIIRWIARRMRMNEDRAAIVLARIAERLEQLLSDRQLLRRVVFWASMNWLFDAAALWVFLRAFNVSVDFDALVIAFGIANVLAAIPITPGGLGYVDSELHRHARRLRRPGRSRHPGGGRVPVRAVLLPDPARRDPVPQPACGPVEHRTARPADAPARPRGGGDPPRRVAHRLPAALPDA